VLGLRAAEAKAAKVALVMQSSRIWMLVMDRLASVATLGGQRNEAGESAESAMPTARHWTMLIIQFSCYSVVGGTAFLADLAVSIALLATGAPILIAFSLGYVIGFLVNYMLSKLLAFRAGRFSRGAELAHFILINLVAIALTILLIRMFITIPSVSPVLAKVIVTPIVLIWNFLGRRFFVFHKDMPAMTAALGAAIVNNFGSGLARIADVPLPCGSADMLTPRSNAIRAVLPERVGEEP
jgi:putative flippase GtrA